MKIMLLGITLIIWLTGCTDPQLDEDGESPLVVADRLHWPGVEGNGAYVIGANFDSRVDLVTHPRMDAPIGTFDGHSLVLADVLVSMDLNDNGNGAQWVISGPQPLIQEYVENLRRLSQDRKPIYSFNSREIDAKPTALFEGNEL